MAPREQRRDADAVRITTAAPSRNEEIAARQKRYIWSMAVRTVCFVAAVAVGPGALRWVLIAGAVFLPYIAVVMANAGPSRRPEPGLRTVSPVGRELGEARPEAPRHDDS